LLEQQSTKLGQKPPNTRQV